MRIFVAGFHHETNTFAPSPADWAAFEAGAGYPPYARGAAMLEQMRGGSLAIAGFAREAQRRGWTLVPSVWAGAMPSNRITAEAFSRILRAMEDDLRAAWREGLAGIFLDLHGAAVAEGADDAEGELLARLRAIVGPELPIVASLDLHANVTQRMLALASGLSVYRTYPHVDMLATGERAAAMLARRMAEPGRRWFSAARRVPFLLPLNAQCTLMEPAASVIAELGRLEARSGAEPSFAMGFSAADFAECGPVVFGHGLDEGALQQAVTLLHAGIVERRAAWRAEFLSPADAVERAIALAAPDRGPVVIADTQDNPGGGGPGDTTGVLRALIGAGARGAVIGAIIDAETAQLAHDVGEGATTRFAIGGKRLPGDSPVQVQGRVRRARSDGWTAVGAMKGGMPVDLGLTALIEIEPEGVLVVVASRVAQTMDSSIFRHLSLLPDKLPIIVVKSSVHFRADFTPLSSSIIVAKAPGPVAIDHTELPYRRLRSGLRLMPKKS